MTHNQACTEAFARYERDHAAWLAQWPNCCAACHGVGGFHSSYDPSPAGVSLSAGSLPDYDPCDACEKQCPRCRGALPDDFWDHEKPCPHCGWAHGKNPGDTEPEPPECLCWLAEEGPGA